MFPLIPLAGGRPDVARGEDPSRRKIWQFELNGLDAVRNVTVRVRSMRDMQMSVCREVKWGEVKVTYQGRTLQLPLTERFLLRTYYLPDGTVPESSSGYWQLPMNLEQSFQRIFGFQLRAGQLQPLSGAELETRGLMAPPSPESVARAHGGQGGSVLRVLVCMALGCARERNDFEPGGVMGAARLIPHLMLVANLPVESMEATVQLARSPNTLHPRMDGEEMSSTISSGFFTDRNFALTPYPTWNNLFDYYWIDPPRGTEVKVVRRDRPGARERGGLIQEVNTVASRASPTVISGYSPRVVKKVPRQGEFDNIHLAPKMRLPPSVLRRIPSSWPRETTMAPFCVHDCFHLHWRWGRPYASGMSPKHTRGWSHDTPYSEPGAPMVPPNQDVSIRLLSASSLAYTARIHAPVVGRWQIVMHHGAAYAISGPSGADALQFLNDVLTTDLLGETSSEGRWANYYWHLRYVRSPHPLRSLEPTEHLMNWLGAQDTYAERLRWNAGGFRAARDL